MGIYLLRRWLRDGREPLPEIFELVRAGLTDKRKPSSGGYRSIAAQCEAGILQAADGPAADAVARLISPLLAARDAPSRTLAARFLTLRALAARDAAALGGLLAHENPAVRKAAAGTVSTQDPVVAERTLVTAAHGDLETRRAVADAIADGLEPGFVTRDDVLAARAALFAADPAARLQAITRFPPWSMDLVDLRAAAPHLGLALSDPDARVREEATLAVYALCDAQGPVRVVRAVGPLIDRALGEWHGEPAARLGSARRALDLRR